MMPSLVHPIGLVNGPSFDYATDAIVSELSRQLSSVSGRRLSRGSCGHRTPGSAMRIAKPSSANNSPQSKLLQSRRRTMINDGPHHRVHLPHAVEYSYLPTPGAEAPREPTNQPIKRAARPVSWHPSPLHTTLPPARQQQPAAMQYAFPPYQDLDVYAGYQQLPPTPAAYSGYNSPASAAAFSPLALPYSNFDNSQYVSPVVWPMAGPPSQAAQLTSASINSADMIPMFEPQLPRLSGSTGSSSDWDSLVERGLDRCTAPPTPEPFEPPQQTVVSTKLATVDSIPFHSLDDDELEGEVLYGMGLYDAPEKSPLDYHRSAVMSLLGPTDSLPEPTGKGLKLEDAWEPPALDEDDDDDDDEDDRDSVEDAEGEDQDD